MQQLSQPQQPQTRQTARICTIHDLVTGSYVQQEGWKPNYVQTSSRKISRANMMGLVVAKLSANNFLLDDGTGVLLIIDFANTGAVSRLVIGQGVLVIGRPRKTNDELFLAAEIIAGKQLLTEPSWLLYRQQELVQTRADTNDEIFFVDEQNEQQVQELSLNQELSSNQESHPVLLEEPIEITGDAIFDFVKQHDNGDGCDIDLIMQTFGQEADDLVLTLISMGELFEIKPGRLKVLE